jgi:hypothetical protein
LAAFEVHDDDAVLRIAQHRAPDAALATVRAKVRPNLAKALLLRPVRPVANSDAPWQPPVQPHRY